MTIWTEASSEVINTAKELIDKYHPDLKEARIGFVFRDRASESSWKLVLGKASKISDKLKPHLELDFLIWIAEEEYRKLTSDQRRALIDHELCHCRIVDGELKMRHHDVEEFNCIIERYGLWRGDLIITSRVFEPWIQAEMDIPEKRGSVISVDPETMRVNIDLG